MLQSMRNKMQGIVAGTIAVIISLTFGLWGVQNYLHTGNASLVAAEVNGKKITKNEVHIAYEQKKRIEMLKYGDNSSFDQNSQVKFRENVFKQLIEQEVISQALAKFGLGIEQGQLWSFVKYSPIFQVNGKFSIDRFQQITARLFYSAQAYLDGLKKTIMQYQFMSGIVGSSFILPSETETIKTIFKQRRDFGYFVIMPEMFAKVVNITELDVKRYYEQHQNEFTVPERVSIQYLKLSSKELSDAIEASAEQLEQFYHSHIASFSTPKEWKVAKVILPLPKKAEVKVIDAARKKLEDIIKNKEDLTKISEAQVATGWLTKKEVGSEIASQLDNLSVGQFSKPFITRDGYIVLKILAIKPEKIQPYLTVAAKVKQMYKDQQLSKAFSEACDKLSDLTYITSDSLEPASKDLGLKIQITDLFTRDSNNSNRVGILANPKIVKAAFSDPVLKQGYNSTLIEIAPGNVVVLRIKSHISETVRPLEQVRISIVQKLRSQIMRKKANDFSHELLAKLLKGGVALTIAKQHGILWHTVTGISRGQNSVNAKLVESAFGLPKPKVSERSAMVVDITNGYAVLQLFRVYDGKSRVEIASERSFLNSLSEQIGQFDYKLLVASLMNKAKIKIFEKDQGLEK